MKLTEYSKGSGCGCKLSPSELKEILKSEFPASLNKNLLVGNESSDDAAVFDLNNGSAIISTVDFFTPLVNDSFDFGSIAACNAISDVYAMGGKPLMALAILGWPTGKLPLGDAGKVLDGARNICEKAGIPLAGGHSIESSEPIFGLAVTGNVKVSNLKKNCTAKEGDRIFITKPLGIGILSAAHKRNVLLDKDYSTLIEITTTLNNIGEAVAELPGVTAMTDITGFGLAGHLLEMCQGSGIGAKIKLDSIPLIEGVKQYSDQFIYPDITTKNYNAYKSFTKGMDGIEFLLLCDPQSSGGLMISVSPEHIDDFIKTVAPFDKFGCATKEIGMFTKGEVIEFY